MVYKYVLLNDYGVMAYKEYPNIEWKAFAIFCDLICVNLAS
jgi:hypothetical protein